jgi:protein SCO1/2
LSTRAWLGLAALALTGLALGLAASQRSRLLPPPEIGGYVLDDPRELPPFELVDGEGLPFRSTDFEGHWSFVYFGYTYCPDVCPLAMVELASLKALLEARADAPSAEYYLVSVDPARDTPERIGEYVRYFDPGFHGLTGPLAEIDKFARAAAVVYVIPDAAEGESYLVGHSSSMTLIDPAGRIHAIFTPPQKAAELATDFVRIASR